MKRTGIGDLAIVALVVAVAAYALLRVAYGSLPLLQWLLPVPIAVLGVIELGAARRVRALLRHDPRAKPMTAISIARCVALGKASALVGAGVFGAGAAFVIRVAPESDTVTAASHDLRVAATLVAAALLLAVGGIVLERAGVDPNNDDKNGNSRDEAPRSDPGR